MKRIGFLFVLCFSFIFLKAFKGMFRKLQGKKESNGDGNTNVRKEGTASDGLFMYTEYME